MHELRVLVEDAVLVHRREHVDVRADRDDEIGFRHDAVRAAEAAATERAECQRMRRRQRVGRVLQRADRNAGQFGELAHLVAHLLADDAAADDEHRLLRFRQHLMHLVELLFGAGRKNHIAIRGRRGRFRRAWLEQHFARRLDMRRALRLGQRDAEGLAHQFLHLLHVRNAVGPFGHRLHEGDLVHVLRRIAFAHHALLHAADADDGDVAAIGSGNAGGKIGDAGAFGRGHHRRTVAGARETIGHESRALFMARQHEADRGTAQRHHEIGVLLAGHAEDMGNAFLLEAADEKIGGFHRRPFAAVSRIFVGSS